jgi:hypothetical protein
LQNTKSKTYRSNNVARGRYYVALLIIGCVILAFLPGPHAVGIVFTIIAIILEWRALIIGIQVSNDGIVIHHYIGTSQAKWEEIKSFEVRPASNYPYTVWTDLKNGKSYCCLGTSAPKYPKKNKVEIQNIAIELNQQLEQNSQSILLDTKTKQWTQNVSKN